MTRTTAADALAAQWHGAAVVRHDSGTLWKTAIARVRSENGPHPPRTGLLKAPQYDSVRLPLRLSLTVSLLSQHRLAGGCSRGVIGGDGLDGGDGLVQC